MNIIAISNHIGAAGSSVVKDFIIAVDTTLGDGLDNYTLNFTGAGYDIKTSDGQTITGATAATTINFPAPGTYDIKIRGDVSTRTFANDLKLVDIKNWGVLNTPLDDKFSGANSLTTITAPDQPVNLNMTRLFKNAQNFAGGISHWDVSNITSFQNAFSNTSFNEDISSWDMSSANTLREMFNYTPFNNGGQPGIGNWDVSNVTNFQGCFTGTPFNQPIGSWTIKTSGPVLMGSMFSQATSFNQDLNAWDVSGVTTMTRMFNVASSFNGDVSNWDVSGVADLGYMFERASSFNHPGIGSWNTSGATSMAGMFDGVNLGMAFNQDISGWDVSNVLQMNNMFRNCYSLDQPFNSWNTSSLQNMSQVFFNCISFNQPLNLWNTSNVTQMQNVFYGASSFNQPLGDWDTSNVINMIGTFRGASSFNQALNLWNTSVVGNMTSMFYGATSFNQDLSTWNTSNVTSLSNAFELTTASSFGIANWDTSSVNNFNATFRSNTSFNEDISGWNVTGCTSNFNDTFYGCRSFNQPIGNWNITSSVTRLSNLLVNAVSFDQDLSSWNISSVTVFNSFALNVTLSTANYDALLVAWESQAPVYSGSIHFGASTYTLGSAAEAARTSLINTYGWTITDGGGIASTKLLDIYSGASAAYSLRDLSSASVGNPVVNVRRSSDNATQDFISTEITNGTLLAFVGNTASDNGYVTTWYDQSGASNNLVQATQANQPKIVSSGVLVERNLKPAVEFDGLASNFLEQTTALSLTEADGFVAVETKNYPPTRVGPLVYNESGLWGYSTSPYSNHYSWSDASIYETFFTTSQVPIATPAVTLAQLNLYNVLSKSSEYSVFLNSNQIFTTATNTVATSGTQRLGASQDSSNNRYYLDGYVSEFIIYPLDQSANRTGIEANINIHYSIYSTYINNLVASYNFDADFTDYTGVNNGTTPGTITHSPFKVNNGADFSGGVNDYVALPNTSDDFTFHNGAGSDIPFSISFWIDDLDGSNSNDCYFWVGNDVNTRSVDIARNGTNVISRCYTNTNNRLEYTYFIGSAVVPVHFCMTYDGSKTPSGLKFYVNGVDAAGTSSQVGTFTGINPTLQMQTRVGTIANFSSYEYEGKMDELHVWKNRVLTAFEVLDVYDTENAGNSILP